MNVKYYEKKTSVVHVGDINITFRELSKSKGNCGTAAAALVEAKKVSLKQENEFNF